MKIGAKNAYVFYYIRSMLDSEYQNEQAYFLTFCIEQYKHKVGMEGAAIKVLFDKTGVTEYLVSHYDILHTQSRQWILEDIEAFIKNHEVK